MKVLFTHSYFLRFDKKQWKQRKPYPPLATIQAASNLRKEGHEVSLFDTNFAHGANEVSPYLNEKPDFLVLYDDGFNYLTKMCLTNMREAAFEMIQMAKKQGIKVFVSSSDSTDHFEQYLQKGADAIILGEADETLLELVKSRENWKTCKGIAYREDDSFEKTAPRASLTNLSELPLPAWDLINIRPYQEAWSIHGYFSINLATTRGCPFKCNWCAKPIYGNRYNSRSPEHVVKEIQLIRSLFEFDHIWFCDDIFGLKPNWIQEFNQVLMKESIVIRYKIQSRADLLVKDDTVKSLAESGCDEVWIGAEIGSQKILDAMDKGTSVEQIEESTLLMKNHKIKPCFFLQFGYLSEDWNDIMATKNMLFKLLPADIGVSVSYPLPGTKFYDKVKSELNQKANWKDSDELLLMYKGSFSPEFYKKLHRYIHKLFRGKQALLQLQKGKLIYIFRYSYFKLFSTFDYFQVLRMKNSGKES
ncbi:MAG: B12-binding domain-containing radical SAM protein [Flavobacteriales bacterium]|nr:B12-binding domain-containing radical SAM protein [Flavobacteriales bacterium]